MKLLILGGGNSPERAVSMRSAKAIANAARQAGFEVVEADPADGYSIFDDLAKGTIVMPILHGQGGEDGILQTELERRELAFLGSGSQVMKTTFDKWKTRQKLSANGIEIAKGALVTAETYPTHPLSDRPHVLKVDRGGSSIGTLIVRDPVRHDKKLANKEVFKLDKQAVLEELVEGIEVTIPILDESALPPLEVIPPEGGEFDYENKYNGASQELCPPPSLNEQQIKDSQTVAEKVHKIMGCKHLSRTDTIMRPNGSFVVLEINTIPGLTDQSLYPKAAQVAGMSMPELVKKFVELVKRDFKLE